MRAKVAKKIAKKKAAPARRRAKPLRGAKRKTPQKRSAPRRPPIDRGALATAEAEIRRLRSTRRRLEQRLTAAVQEIGTLRTFELRAQMLENELAKRDIELSRLRAESGDRLGGASIVSTPASN
jgi:hypothetical protein